MKQKLLILIISLLALIGCAGTLGGFDRVTFKTSKRNVVNAIDTLFVKNPEYLIPKKWKKYDDWKAKRYDFLDSRIFYFKSSPEEMYYVTFYGDANHATQTDTTKTSISIRAFNNGSQDWHLESKTSEAEKNRIQKRFKEEIISKLEKYIIDNKNY